jgi:hypothetical protein
MNADFNNRRPALFSKIYPLLANLLMPVEIVIRLE